MNKKANIITGAISSFLCLLIFALMVSMGIIFNINSTFNQKTATKIIEKMDMAPLIENKDGEPTEIFSYISDEMQKNGIPEQTTKTILQSEAFKQIITPYLSDISGYLFEGKIPEGMTQEKIIDIVKENMEPIAYLSGTVLTDQDKKEILNSVSEKSHEILNEIPAAQDIVEDNLPPQVVSTIRGMLSLKVKLILIGSTLLLIGLLVFLRFRKSWYEWLAWNGATTILAGISVLGFGLVVNLFGYSVGSQGDIADTLLTPLSQIITKGLIISGAIGCFTGLLQVGGFIFLQKSLKKNKIKEDLDNTPLLPPVDENTAVV
ncbi:MAG: hypothetical protein K0R90_106 [Oscillospiraceae bacterium]|jgi:hypothetical protein|nr:hypothetical protein [Oscillospiraceae bacterium]